MVTENISEIAVALPLRWLKYLNVLLVSVSAKPASFLSVDHEALLSNLLAANKIEARNSIGDTAKVIDTIAASALYYNPFLLFFRKMLSYTVQRRKLSDCTCPEIHHVSISYKPAARTLGKSLS